MDIYSKFWSFVEKLNSNKVEPSFLKAHQISSSDLNSCRASAAPPTLQNVVPPLSMYIQNVEVIHS
jgi:hypothetical protein